jgi:hypothetical protein
MKINPKAKDLFFQISAVLIVIAAVIYHFDATIAKYMMVVGVAGFAATTFTSPYPGKSLRGKRLFNIQILAVLLMAASSFLMFKEMSGWVVTMLIAAILTLYCSVALPQALKKDKEENQ